MKILILLCSIALVYLFVFLDSCSSAKEVTPSYIYKYDTIKIKQYVYRYDTIYKTVYKACTDTIVKHDTIKQVITLTKYIYDTIIKIDSISVFKYIHDTIVFNDSIYIPKNIIVHDTIHWQDTSTFELHITSYDSLGYKQLMLLKVK